MMIVIRYLHSPLVQSLLLHSALLATLWLFSAHFIPELPPASAPLQATLVSSASTPTPPEPTNTPLENIESLENNQPLAVPEPNVSPIGKQEAKEQKIAKEKADKEAKEQKIAKEKADKEVKEQKIAKEKADKDAKEQKIAKEKADKEAKEQKIAKEKADKEAKEQKIAKEKADKEAKEQKIAKEKADKEAKEQKIAKEKADKEAKEQKIAKEKADKEAKEQKIAKEKADKDAKEQARKKLQETLTKNSFDKEMAVLEGKIKAEKEAQLRKDAALAAQKEAERLAKERADKEAKDKLNQEQLDLADKYKKRIYETIKREWSIPPKSADLSAQVRIVLLPDGEVRSILFLKRSGNQAFDASIEAAINKASPLPVPSDAALFNQFRSVTFNFSSKD